jgi:hypothetical protein
MIVLSKIIFLYIYYYNYYNNNKYHSYYYESGPQREVNRKYIDPNFIAGMSTGTKQNHPYNFSYGDQGMPEEKEYRVLDTGLYKCICIFIYVCICVYVFIDICVYIHIYIYIYIHTSFVARTLIATKQHRIMFI